MGKVIYIEDWKKGETTFLSNERHQGSGLDLIWFDSPEFIPLNEAQIKNHYWWTELKDPD